MIFCLDANFVIPRLMAPRRGELTTPNQLERLQLLHQNQAVQVEIPSSVQLEIYTVLRYKGIPLKHKETGKWIRQTLLHDEIMHLTSLYSEFFDSQFLSAYRKINFGTPYKQALFQEIEYILNMNFDVQKEFIESNTGADISNLNDQDDFHVMVGALKLNADFLVTNNFDDMINPIGKCNLVKNEEVLNYIPR